MNKSSKAPSVGGRRARAQSAVYVITCVATGKFYVGSSVDVSKRLGRHREDLKAGGHHSRHLQRAWDGYGEVNFRFDIVEYVPPDDIRKVEQEWIDRCRSADRNHGYNMHPKALGSHGYTVSSEVRKKMSDSHKGRSLPAEQRAKMGSVGSKHPGSKLDEWAVHTIKARVIEGEGQKALAEEFRVSRTTVNDIVAGRTWAHVKMEEPVPRRRTPGLHSALRPEQVSYIKAQLACGARGTPTRLSREFGVGFSTIADIQKGRTWAHVQISSQY